MRKFLVRGGRGGTITFSEGERAGAMEWEMLVVGDVQMVIYHEGCRWTEPQVTPMSREEATRLVSQFASESGLRVALEFADSAPEIFPR